jgi:hypothetical protein
LLVQVAVQNVGDALLGDGEVRLSDLQHGNGGLLEAVSEDAHRYNHHDSDGNGKAGQARPHLARQHVAGYQTEKRHSLFYLNAAAGIPGRLDHAPNANVSHLDSFFKRD